MFDPKVLDNLAQKLADALPSGFVNAQQDAEKTLRAGLESTLSRLNMVSRDEFETQSAVLARSREKIDQLEKQVANLEKAFSK
ncbi:MAG: accessory factor UbiK family protein [Gammaproteobacteria bacterium]|nr:accessory factor UbiK family protein [Gammaproteobacteria bacterium]